VEDLRNWLESVDRIGQGPGRKRGPRNGVISEIKGQRRGPVLLFAEIPGFRKGFRIVTGSILNAERLG
jgi:hypothetical protein